MAQLEHVREALHQQPFRAFEIRLLDGRSFSIKHPDFVMLPPTRRKRDIAVWDEDGMHLIDLALVQEILVKVDSVAGRGRRPRGNGGT